MTFHADMSGAIGAAVEFPGGIAEGANVRTPCGARRIELVRPGDLVVTRDQGLMPVRLVWMRLLSAAQLAAVPDLAPLRLKPRIAGPMMPQRDLVLAPDQLVLVPGFRVAGHQDCKGCLIEARDLGGASDKAYVDRSVENLRLITLVFDSPQVFTVNGLPVESFVANAARIASLAQPFREAVTQRFPQLRHEPSSYPPGLHPFVSAAEYLPALN